jgi:hypothetical protein
MHPESLENQAELFPKVGEAMIANMLQIRLMPLAYQVDHPGTEVSMADPQKRNEVAAEWATKYAQPFREYIEDNPREPINIHDEAALIEFFMKVKEYTTVH